MTVLLESIDRFINASTSYYSTSIVMLLCKFKILSEGHLSHRRGHRGQQITMIVTPNLRCVVKLIVNLDALLLCPFLRTYY